MKIVVLGGGLTGLVCAEKLSRGGKNKVVLIESESGFGGLASGFRQDNWDWSLDRVYHHVFSSDSDILDYAKEVGFDKFFFKSPTTSSLYHVNGHFRLLPIDTPVDLLSFPLLNIFERIRAGVAILFLKLSPHLKLFERTTTSGLMTNLMGKRAYEVLFGEVMRKKFGKYAGNILSGFIWARILKRSKNLGYPEGGFQEFINHLVEVCRKNGVELMTSSPVTRVFQKEDEEVVVAKGDEILGEFDMIICTTPSQVASKTLNEVLRSEEIENLGKTKHLAAMNIILETRGKFFDTEYWISNCVTKIPALVFVQHTNFIDKSNYGSNDILYIGEYLQESSPLWSMAKDELVKIYTERLEEITGRRPEIVNSFQFKAKNSQPIFDREFINIVPTFQTSNKRILLANLDMTYPFDRGTNYAVLLGQKVADILIDNLQPQKNEAHP